MTEQLASTYGRVVFNDLAGRRTVDELATLIMRELEGLGGVCNVDDLKERIRVEFPTPERFRETPEVWVASFDHEFHAVMWILVSFDEVRRILASVEHPHDRYEMVEQVDPDETERRRRDWIYDPDKWSEVPVE